MENEFKVREIGYEEEKSVQEIEEQLLNKHEEENKQDLLEQAPTPEAPVEEEPKEEIKDQDVLSYIKNRYQKEINSLD